MTYSDFLSRIQVIEKYELDAFEKKIVLSSGAVAAGVPTKETLQGGPPSTDLTYVLPGAKSAVPPLMRMPPQ